MKIDWREGADREVIELARAVRSRCMKGIAIGNFKEEQNEDLLDFLTHNWADQLREFYFDAYTNTYNWYYGSADYYLNGIEKVGKENILHI